MCAGNGRPAQMAACARLHCRPPFARRRERSAARLLQSLCTWSGSSLLRLAALACCLKAARASSRALFFRYLRFTCKRRGQGSGCAAAERQEGGGGSRQAATGAGRDSRPAHLLLAGIKIIFCWYSLNQQVKEAGVRLEVRHVYSDGECSAEGWAHLLCTINGLEGCTATSRARANREHV